MPTFGEEIQQARRRRTWTQGRLGQEVGVSQGHISRIELGSTLDIPTVKKLCDVLELDYYRLVRGHLGVDSATQSAITDDPTLRSEDRQLLLTIYAELQKRGPMSDATD
jgi:transcriptional regulator with XRE-family HTH domain